MEDLFIELCKNGSLDRVLILKSMYPNLNLKYRYNYNLLNICSNGDIQLLLYLLDIDDKSINYDKLFRVAVNNNNIKIFDILIQYFNISEPIYLFKLATTKNYNNIAFRIFILYPIYSIDNRNLFDWLIKHNNMELLIILIKHIPDLYSNMLNVNRFTNWYNTKCPNNIRKYINKYSTQNLIENLNINELNIN